MTDDKKEPMSLEKFGDRQPHVAIEVKNLVVAPIPRTHLQLGDVPSLASVVERAADRIRAIVWNEETLTLDVDDLSREIHFQPELKPSAAMFFTRENKRENVGFGEKGARIWEGDFEPVKFGKRNFLKFIKAHMTQFPTDVAESLKNLKMSQITTSDETLLDDESDNERRVEEQIERTNVPKTFTAMIPIAENFEAELHFETKVYKERDSYGNRGQVVVEVRCLNARQVLRDMMEGILAQLPSEIPRLYGSLSTLG